MSDRSSTDEPLPTRTEAEGATVDLPEGLGFFTTGQVLGDRYEILEMLGRGGMGEVWRAFDLKLRVEVGLKALREELFQSERRLELLRQEVRAAREVVSPNVCRIFDLIEIDGRELVSMEYVDGATLLGVLQERGPLELKEAQDIASQFLAGLEAIHKAGLVHRDVKPENIMLTRAGRVVVMDFGLARQETEGGGSVSGTPAYMAPEHAAGGDVDARADVYSAGVVLAEMVSPEGIKSYESRQSVWEGVRSEPAQIPDSPWAPVIKRAVARDRERRQNSAHTLIRELEDVTLRVEGAEDLHPYPGLASFTEEDAEYFFGREAEIEQMWRRLDGSPRMLGLIGPSGAGKTSFINAGVIPNAGANWSITTCSPGSTAFRSLGRALASELAGDAEAMRELVDLDDLDSTVSAVSRWRGRHDNAVLVVDQFEELFTLNSLDSQTRFTELLGRLVIEADVFVVLSMRDDFFFNCHQFEALNPVVTELTLLGPPTGGALRRALVQPATKCGYRFEDDVLVEELLAEVEGERGALPLLAFALARLWEKRDRESGLLTRQAYHDIGGVGGALARHAEATVDHIGVERIPVVRELFRNLVTAEGTRAVREWDELLSVFEGEEVRKLESEKVRKSALPAVASKELRVRTATSHSEHRERSLLTASKASADPSPLTATEGSGLTPHSSPSHSERSPSHPLPDRGGEAAEVLRELIDARLLTSYEVREDEHEPTRRVEIIHESLLANWPRLVRWQTQDQEGAQLRDELRQSARAWDEHGRHDDRLWTGTAYREFRVWRERYPGGLTDVEEAFGTAMTSFAGRRRRRRRIVVAAVIALLLAGLAVVGSFWQESVREALRAEAASLLSRAQLELEPFPSSAVAYATASLELSDNPEARRLALEALWKGPTAFVADERLSFDIEFSPDGQMLLQATDEEPFVVRVVGANGSIHELEDVYDYRVNLVMGTGSNLFATLPSNKNEPFALWSATERTLLAKGQARWPEKIRAIYQDLGRARLILLRMEDDSLVFDALPFSGKMERLGVLPHDLHPTHWCGNAPHGQWTAVADHRGIHLVELGDHEISEPRFLSHLRGRVADVECDPLGRFIAARYDDNLVRLWNLNGESTPRSIQAPSEFSELRISNDGSTLETTLFNRENRTVETSIWSIGTDMPVFHGRVNLGKHGGTGNWSINPIKGHVVSAVNPDTKTRVWRLGAPSDADPITLNRGEIGTLFRVAVHPHGQWVATSGSAGLVFWPMSRPYPIVFSRYEERAWNLTFGPNGQWIATSDINSGIIRLWQLGGVGSPSGEIIFEAPSSGFGLAASPDGKHILSGNYTSTVRMISLETGDVIDLPGDMTRVWGVGFSPSGQFAAASGHRGSTSDLVMRIWDLASQQQMSEIDLGTEGFVPLLHFASNSKILTSSDRGLISWDLQNGSSEILVEEPTYSFAISPDRSRVVYVEVGSTPRAGFSLPHGRVRVLDLESGASLPLPSHGERVGAVGLDATGTIAVTGDMDGVIRVGPIDGGEPQILLGSPAEIAFLAVDPQGRWIASAAGAEVRLWPMPDLSKPPLHTLPREELIAKLKTLTNLRVVRDPESSTGWKLTHDPFPGWETVPTW